MRNLYNLIEFEFRFIFRLILVISILLVAGQNFLLYITSRTYSAGRYIPFEKLISQAGFPVMFFICFALVLACCVYSVVSNFIGSKSIYTLMTIAQRRGNLFLSKLAAGAIAVAMLFAAQFISIFIGYSLFSTSILKWDNDKLSLIEPVNGLFLSFVRSDFLRSLFPLGLESMISTAVILVSVVCGTYYAVYSIQSRKYFNLAMVVFNLILAIFILSYRINALSSFEEQNLYIYGGILLLISAYYIWQCNRWISRSTNIG